MTGKIQQNHESGRSLIEMVGVLALMGLLTAVAFVLVQSGMTAQKISRVADEVNTLVANVRAVAAEKGDFGNLPNCQEAEDIGAPLAAAILDSEKNSKVESAIGGYYSVCSDNCTSGVCEEFWVYIYNMDSSADCEMLETRAFSGGTAACDGSVLKIKYTK